MRGDVLLTSVISGPGVGRGCEDGSQWGVLQAGRRVTTRSICPRGSWENPLGSEKHEQTRQTATRCRSLCKEETSCGGAAAFMNNQ